MNKLLLGSGQHTISGWTRVDADSTYRPDFVAAIPPLPKEIHDKKWDEVMLIHFIEHVHFWKAEELLKEIYTILKDGGKVILEQPNIEIAAKALLKQISIPSGMSPGQMDMWCFYGDPTHKNPLYSHYWGYTPETLTSLLITCGFKQENIRVLPAQYHVPQRDFRIEGIK